MMYIFLSICVVCFTFLFIIKERNKCKHEWKDEMLENKKTDVYSSGYRADDNNCIPSYCKYLYVFKLTCKKCGVIKIEDKEIDV